MTETKTPSTKPWVEKYRPNRLQDIAHQDDAIKILKGFAKDRNVPHLILYGPAGTGKTSAALALAHELFGSHAPERLLEINASSACVLEDIRTTVQTFAQAKATETKDMPSFKILVLDEADAIPEISQKALRRMMEEFAHVTRFVMICNQVSRIIDPLRSRCVALRFQALDADAMDKRLTVIADAEKAKVSAGAFETIIKLSRGDMRQAVTLLQSSTWLAHIQVKSKHVLQVAEVVPSRYIDYCMLAIKSNSFDTMAKTVQGVLAEGYAADRVLEQFLFAVKDDEDIEDVDKAKIGIAIAEADKKLLDGADAYLQLLSVFSVASVALHAPR